MTRKSKISEIDLTQISSVLSEAFKILRTGSEVRAEIGGVSVSVSGEYNTRTREWEVKVSLHTKVSSKDFGFTYNSKNLSEADVHSVVSCMLG